jgi:2-methylcitrate dehydratase PrpD
MDGNDLAAEFIRDMTWDSLPSAARRQAKMCLLDDLGAAVSGTLTHISHITADYAAARMAGDEATILLHRKCASAPGAAFANGYAGNGLDIDDGGKYTRGHPGAQLLPAALAVAEKVGAGGRALLEALVVGYEIAHRTARAWHDHHEVYQACGSWGSVACAAAAARLMRLDHEQIKHALGIAEYHAPNLPMMRDIDHPSMVKHGIGWAAMNGVMSAELAEHGFTGIPSILGFEKYRPWVSTLGSEYIMIEGVSRKRWCSCAWGHPSFVAALKLREAHVFSVDDITGIQVYTFHEAWRLSQRYPESTEEAQFSVKWPLAALLVDGEVGPDQVLESRLGDVRLRALSDKIDIIEDPEIDRMYRLVDDTVDEQYGLMTSRVVINLADGRTLDSGIVERGAHDWDEASLERKFHWITSYAIDQGTRDRLANMVWEFDRVASVKELTTLLQ